MSAGNEFLQKRVQKFTYKPSVDGGTAAATYNIGILPANSLITAGYAHVVTAFGDDDDNSTTISIGYTGAATAFMAAAAVSTLTNDAVIGLLPGVPVLGVDASHDTAAEVAVLNAASYIYLTADKHVLITINNDHNVDAGEIDIFLEYVSSLT
jgi:hypothetical protein